MTLYHVSKNGEPGVCGATVQDCPLGAGEGEHIETDDIDEARSFAEQKLNEEYSTLPASQSKTTSSASQGGDERAQALAMLPDPRVVNSVSELSAQEVNTVNTLAEKDYKERINSTDDAKEKRAAQLAYDATPAGKKELQSQLSKESKRKNPNKKSLAETNERLSLAERNQEVIAGYYLRQTNAAGAESY